MLRNITGMENIAHKVTSGETHNNNPTSQTAPAQKKVVKSVSKTEVNVINVLRSIHDMGEQMSIDDKLLLLVCILSHNSVNCPEAEE